MNSECNFDYDRYLKFSYWTGLECIALLSGYTPDEYDSVVKAEQHRQKEFIERNSRDNRYTERTELDKEQLKLSRNRRNWLKKTKEAAEKVSDVLVRDIELGIFTPDCVDSPTVYFTPTKFINWAQQKGFDVPDELIAFAKKTIPQTESVENDVAINGRRARQITMITGTALTLGYDLLNIPESGKAKIKAECLKDTDLFTDSAFKKAWSNASVGELISITDKKKYL